MKSTADLKFRVWVLGCFFFASTLLASFEPLPVGGRAAGMGEANTAIVDDVFSLYYNPAGVMQLDRPEIGSYYSQLYPGLTDGSQISRMFIGYAQPIKKGKKAGGMGVSYNSLTLSGLYKEETIGLTYGREFRHLWNLGGSVKFLRKQLGTDPYSNNAVDPVSGNPTGSADPILAGSKSKSAIGIDLGLQYRLTQAYALGMSARNINSPDISLGAEKDVAPAVYTAALARRLRNGSLDIEVINFKTAAANTQFKIGGEHWFKNGFALRAGGGLGSRSYSTLSFGASYKMESLQIDYATILPLQGIQGTFGVQQVSLTVRLGKPPVDPLENQLIREKEQRIKAETEARSAIAERDRLKKQLLDLTESKSKEKQFAEEEAARRVFEEAQRQAVEQQNQENATSNNPTNDVKALDEYTAALSNYNSKVQQGIGLDEKKKILGKILTQFGDNPRINTTTVKRELKTLNVEEARMRKDFELSMNFYQRLAQQGASNDERKAMLQRIIQKYQGSGIDTKMAEDEMNKLK